MLFICNSRARPGVTREQLVEQLNKGIDKEAWELIKKGTVAHWMYKVGDEPGVVAIVNCASREEVQSLADNSRAVKLGLIEYTIDPVDHFPHFS
jgi:hypothetical protein